MMNKEPTCNNGCCQCECAAGFDLYLWRNRYSISPFVDYCPATGQKLYPDGTLGLTHARLEEVAGVWMERAVFAEEDLADATRGIGVPVKKGEVQDDS